MTTTRTANVKMLSAVIGGSAVLTLGVLAPGQQPDASVQSAKMSLGGTTTTTTPPTAVETSKAVPSVTGPAPLPSEEEAAK